MGEEFVVLSLTPLLIGCLAAVVCALPGNFLVLRKQALIGDAISHVVLPGIVVAFLVTGVISTWPMLIGSALAALVAVAMIEGIKRFGRIEPGAAAVQHGFAKDFDRFGPGRIGIRVGAVGLFSFVPDRCFNRARPNRDGVNAE